MPESPHVVVSQVLAGRGLSRQASQAVLRRVNAGQCWYWQVEAGMAASGNPWLVLAGTASCVELRCGKPSYVTAGVVRYGPLRYVSAVQGRRGTARRVLAALVLASFGRQYMDFRIKEVINNGKIQLGKTAS